MDVYYLIYIWIIWRYPSEYFQPTPYFLPSWFFFHEALCYRLIILLIPLDSQKTSSDICPPTSFAQHSFGFPLVPLGSFRTESPLQGIWDPCGEVGQQPIRPMSFGFVWHEKLLFGYRNGGEEEQDLDLVCCPTEGLQPAATWEGICASYRCRFLN